MPPWCLEIVGSQRGSSKSRVIADHDTNGTTDGAAESGRLDLTPLAAAPAAEGFQHSRALFGP